MHNIHRILSRLLPTSLTTITNTTRPRPTFSKSVATRFYSVGGDGDTEGSDSFGWDTGSSWSTGLTKAHFDGEVIGRMTGESPSSSSHSGISISRAAVLSELQEIDDQMNEFDAENKRAEEFEAGWDDRVREISMLLKQVKEPGARGSYLKDSEKNEMYRLHKENPEVYTIERLAKDYRIMRQRVHAILWLKEEEEEERKQGKIHDDSVELLLDTCPE